MHNVIDQPKTRTIKMLQGPENEINPIEQMKKIKLKTRQSKAVNPNKPNEEKDNN